MEWKKFWRLTVSAKYGSARGVWTSLKVDVSKKRPVEQHQNVWDNFVNYFKLRVDNGVKIKI